MSDVATKTRSANLRLAEIHLRMLLHKLLEHVLLSLLVGGGKARRLLPLIIHHLLHRLPRVAVEIRQLGVLRLHLLRVDLGIAHDHRLPPLHLIALGECDAHYPIPRLRVVFDGPKAILHFDRLFELAAHDRLAPLDLHLERFLENVDCQGLRLRARGHCDVHLEILQTLRPPVVVVDGSIVDGNQTLALTLVFFPLLLSLFLALTRPFCGCPWRSDRNRHIGDVLDAAIFLLLLGLRLLGGYLFPACLLLSLALLLLHGLLAALFISSLLILLKRLEHSLLRIFGGGCPREEIGLPSQETKE
mmetsp:Transcript_4347/g.9414  ORF Transcript_4347/g.9414 Transcript_4347/m.9414 type:complete len:303 (-) Transcript_4347:164-1072(-)